MESGAPKIGVCTCVIGGMAIGIQMDQITRTKNMSNPNFHPDGQGTN